MIEEERSPALRRRAPASGHVLGYRGLAYVDAELEEFSMYEERPEGFAKLISRISCRTSRGTLGLPTPLRDFQRQNMRKPARCQRRTVCGSTIVKASRIRGAIRYKHMKTKRSKLLKTGRFGDRRCSTFS